MDQFDVREVWEAPELDTIRNPTAL